MVVRTDRHDTGSTSPRSVGEVALIWDTITGQSAVILRQHTTPFRPMIVRSMIWSLSIKSLRTLEPPHTRKFPRVNAQDSKLGPIQPWDVKDFFNGAKVAVVRPNEPYGGQCLRQSLIAHFSAPEPRSILPGSPSTTPR
jgi:hypothetical protein